MERKNHTQDRESRRMLYEGCTITQLAEIFRMDKKKCSSLLAGLEPCGSRQGFPIYDLFNAASRLATPSEKQLMRTLERMSPSKLPTHLQKEFWDARRSRQQYEENARDLWRTSTIVDFTVGMLKTVRDSVTVMEDVVARESDLTNKQRQIIQQLVDDLLSDIERRFRETDIYKSYTNSLHADEDDSVKKPMIEVEAPEDEDLGL